MHISHAQQGPAWAVRALLALIQFDQKNEEVEDRVRINDT